MNSPASASNSTDHAAVLQWIGELQRVKRGTAHGELLHFGEVNALDVLLAPVYLAALGALRKGPEPAAVSQALVQRLRRLAYQAKIALQQRVTARRSAPVGRAEVLLWTRDVTHTAVLTPVAHELNQSGTPARMLACQAKVFDGVQNRVPDTVYTLGAWPGTIRRARREGAARARRLAALGAWRVPELAHPRSRYLEPAVRDCVLQFLPSVAEAVANAHAALDRFRPRVLVVGNDLTLEGRAACRVATARGIPTATFMHGSITGDAMQSHHVADRLLVFGEVHRQEMIERGIAGERIVVCGAPHMDQRARQTGQVHEALARQLGLRPGQPWVLVATSGPGHRISHAHHEQVVRNLARLAEDLPDVPLVIKLHRKDRLEYYQSALAGAAASRLRIVPTDMPGYPQDILEWLQGCSLVLTGASTVALEAMLMDVPVITMDFCDEIHEVDFIDAGATLHVRSYEALQAAVRETLDRKQASPEIQARVEAHMEACFFALDGCSARRGAESVRELMASE